MSENIILNKDTQQSIPKDNSNRHYQEYLAWLAEGNEPEIASESSTEVDAVEEIVKSSIEFGNKILIDFTVENVKLGITSDNMTKYVRQIMAEVISALQTGSLYDAIDEVKAIPREKRDGKYLDTSRLIRYVNRIEDFLGKPRSKSL